ncbi:MAG: tryptophanase [Planctomycetota bacterium]
MPREGSFRTIIEPFRVKMVEPIRMTTRREREALIAAAGYNPFLLKAEDVLIDLLTDSGTSAMSQEQWAGMMRGDESYACAKSWFRFQETVQELFGFEHVIPTHQGRAAEALLFSTMVEPGQVVINNSHFDTTRANVEAVGGEAIDLPCPELREAAVAFPFKGNIDLERLEKELRQRPRGEVALVMMTITNNTGGGQPASLENVRAASELAHRFGVPFYLDACRFAENAWFIKKREDGQSDRPVQDIALELFSLADGCTFSAKKDAFANIGGFLATRDVEIARLERNRLILTEGFPTYGGMAGRDLEAVAIGLREVLDEDYLHYRIASTAYVQRSLEALGVPVVRPAGGHAVYIDARRMLPHVSPIELPGQALVVALYEEAGIRSCEIGTVMFGRYDPETGEETEASQDLVRLAIPRRVYTQSHMDFVVEALGRVFDRCEDIGGFAFVSQEPVLRHFTARFRPIRSAVSA